MLLKIGLKEEKQKSKTVFETHFLFFCLKDEIHAKQSQNQN